MAYREKIAWLTLLCISAAYTLYFAGLIAIGRAGEPEVVPMITLFIGVTLAQIVVLIIAAVVMTVRARREAQRSADERDRLIARRGTSFAYFVLMVGMFVVGVVMPFVAKPWQVYNAGLLALVTAEAARYLMIVISYRRGWHG